jgi:hypothetical protein
MGDASGPVVELGVGAGIVAQSQRDLIGAKTSVGNQSGIHP